MYDYSNPNGNTNMNGYGGYPAMGYPPNMQVGYYPQPQQYAYYQQPIYQQPITQPMYDMNGNIVNMQPQSVNPNPNPYLCCGMNPDMGQQPVYDVFGNLVPLQQQALIQNTYGQPINNDRFLNKDEQTYVSERIGDAIDDIVNQKDAEGKYKTIEEKMDDQSKLYAKYTTNMPPTLGANITLTDANGNSRKVSLDGENHYVAGSYGAAKANAMNPQQTARFFPGGYNPATGMITQPGPAYQQPYVGYSNPYANQYIFTRGCWGYPMTAGDKELEQYLYDTADIPVMDLREELCHIVLTEEEQRARENKKNAIVGYDYYGNPVFNRSAYEYNVQAQKAIQNRRKEVQDFYVNLSKVCHHYFGEEIIEDNVRARFDPLPPAPVQKSVWDMTPEEREKFRKDQEDQAMLTAGKNAAAFFNNGLQYLPPNTTWRDLREFEINLRWSKIKESHDKLLGLTPGEPCDIAKYSENSYRLMDDIKRKEAFMKRVDGRRKFDPLRFLGSMAHKSNSSLRIRDGIDTDPLHSVRMETKDGTYKSIGEITQEDLCPSFEEFILRKKKMAESIQIEKTKDGKGEIYITPDGKLTSYSSPSPVAANEDKMDYEFFKAGQEIEDRNNSVRGLPQTPEDERLDSKFKDYLDKRYGGSA